MVWARGGRVFEVAPGDAVSCVCTLGISLIVLPLVVAWVIAIKERAAIEKSKLVWSLTDDSYFVAVLEVSTDA